MEVQGNTIEEAVHAEYRMFSMRKIAMAMEYWRLEICI